MTDTYHGIWIKSYKEYCYFNDQPGAYFRKSFTAPEQIKKAEIQICGLGFHEIFLNGEKVGDRWYAPGLSQYDFRCGSITYDISGMLIPGSENVIIIMLGNGFFNCHNEWQYTVNFYSWRTSPRLICDILINDETAVSSGTDWKIHPSPIVFDGHHLGEDYDARLELPEAFKSGFDDSTWANAFRAYPPGGILEHDTDEPCRVISRHPGKSITPAGAGFTVFDFGTTIAGVIDVKMRGRRGSKVTFKYGEVTGDDGHIDTAFIDAGASRFETDSYIFKGKDIESWHPHFVWHGFRYVEVIPEDPETEIIDITGLFIASDLKNTGTLTTGNAILNRVHELTRTSYMGNFMGIPTDCPTREKFGWIGDANCALETGWWNYYPVNGLRRLVDIIMDIQRPDGNLATHGPTTLWGFEQSCPTYTVFMYEFCRYCWLFDGDDRMISKYYDKLVKGISFFEIMTADDHLCHVGYADWCHPLYRPGKPGGELRDPTAVESIAWYSMLQDMVLFAGHLGKSEDESRFRELGEKVKCAIRRKYYDPEKHTFDGGFWTTNAMALMCGIADDGEKAAVAANLVSSIRNENHRMLAGIQGARFILRALTENGYAADACQMIIQPEYPGWGNLVANGATALWEMWNGKASRNHIMFAEPSAWMYRYLAGISPLAPGFAKVRFAPNFVPQVDHVRAEHLAPAGKIAAEWRRTGNTINCCFTLPDGISAVVELPGITREISESTEFTFEC
ncbi:MAG: family 78 glycoside hydrolase catalytic domain [Lentisphaeria bacterium]|nr:family 78 glycoside hydrolase catalytic domain [Lentisphaeria bacterium]